MRVVNPGFEFLTVPDAAQMLQLIEKAGRTCYKSETNITETSAKNFVGKIIKSGHLSVIEHVSMTVRFICDRGISHELVRHRMASFSQESTRYANYAKDRFDNEITVIRPFFWEEGTAQWQLWYDSMLAAEKTYMELIAKGASPQQARSVLPNSLKTELVMTANLREWRHVMELRCAPDAHPQVREIMIPFLQEANRLVPVVFEDLAAKYTDFTLM